MKIDSKIKKVYTHLWMAEDKEGSVRSNQVFFSFSYSKVYVRYMIQFVFFDKSITCFGIIMKISSELKDIYTHFCKAEDKDGRLFCSQVYFSFSNSNVYDRQMTEFVFVNCVTVSNVFNYNVPVMAFLSP